MRSLQGQYFIQKLFQIGLYIDYYNKMPKYANLYELQTNNDSKNIPIHDQKSTDIIQPWFQDYKKYSPNQKLIENQQTPQVLPGVQKFLYTIKNLKRSRTQAKKKQIVFQEIAQRNDSSKQKQNQVVKKQQFFKETLDQSSNLRVPLPMNYINCTLSFKKPKVMSKKTTKNTLQKKSISRNNIMLNPFFEKPLMIDQKKMTITNSKFKNNFQKISEIKQQMKKLISSPSSTKKHSQSNKRDLMKGSPRMIYKLINSQSVIQNFTSFMFTQRNKYDLIGKKQSLKKSMEQKNKQKNNQKKQKFEKFNKITEASISNNPRIKLRNKINEIINLF